MVKILMGWKERQKHNETATKEVESMNEMILKEKQKQNMKERGNYRN